MLSTRVIMASCLSTNLIWCFETDFIGYFWKIAPQRKEVIYSCLSDEDDEVAMSSSILRQTAGSRRLMAFGMIARHDSTRHAGAMEWLLAGGQSCKG